MAKIIPLPIHQPLVCSSCGADGEGSCRCGAPYVPAGQRAADAVAANPDKSDRVIAEEIGVNRRTVIKARKELVQHAPVDGEKRTGKDGRRRRVPTPPPGRPARARSSEKRLPVDIACEIVRPLVVAGQSVDPKTLAKKHPISHVTFEKAVAIERAVQRVHDEYRVDAVVRQHFTAKGRPEPTISNPVAEVNAFHRELVRFTADVSARLTTWMKSGPRLDEDGKAALMQALYLCADECAELAQKLDGR